MKNQKEENLIHIKVEYGDLLESKKHVLSSEMNLLRMIKIVRRYRALRDKEMTMKIKLDKKMKETIEGIKKLSRELPHIEIKNNINEDYEYEESEEKRRGKKSKGRGKNKSSKEVKSDIIERIQEEKYDQDLEHEIYRIQQKLREIGG